MATKTVYIFQGTTTFQVPADFGSLLSIDCIGAGGGTSWTGDSGDNCVGGAGGGAWAQITALSGLTPSGNVTVQVGLGGLSKNGASQAEGNDGTDTWFSNTGSTPTTTSEGVLAKGGKHGPLNMGGAMVGGAGGLAAEFIGTSKNNGGDGGDTNNGTSGQGGGGAAGPHGVGGSGGNDSNNGPGGTGGGGADGGENGVDNSTEVGNAGGASGTDATPGGTGGAAGVNGNPGSHGSGGGGGGFNTTGSAGAAGGNGGAGLGWIQTSDAAVAGPGGGGGGSSSSPEAGEYPGNGGLYGGGAGGLGYNDISGLHSGAGANGIIVFTYTVGAATLILADQVVDSGLAAFANADKMYVCSSTPTDYNDVLTKALGNYNAGAGNLFGAIATGSPTGRQVTSVNITSGTITADGTVNRWAVVASGVSPPLMLANGIIDAAEAVTNGQAFSLAPITIDLPGR